MGALFKIVLYIFILVCTFTNVSGLKWNEHILDGGDRYVCCPSSMGSVERDSPHIYCYNGRPKQIIHLFETVLLEIDLLPEQYTLYEGNTPDDVMMEFESHRSLWNMNIFSWKNKDVRLSTFNNTCIGILTNKNYTVELNILRVDFWRVLMFSLGIALFFSGPKLSNNVLFYYICGVSLGVFASFIILVYFISRLFPRKPMMYGFLVGGWAISVYVLQKLWDNIRTLSIVYRKYLMGYFIITGLISFIICYRIGPVTDPRSKNIIKWTLQCLGLVMVIFCSEFQEATLAIDILILTFYSLPSSSFRFLKSYYNRFLTRPKPRLLTEDEYYDQGAKETAKALEGLRGFCSSPNCDQWKTVTKLKDPIRFAKFVQGGSHLSDGEVLSFETETNKHVVLNEDNFTDDSE